MSQPVTMNGSIITSYPLDKMATKVAEEIYNTTKGPSYNPKLIYDLVQSNTTDIVNELMGPIQEKLRRDVKNAIQTRFSEIIEENE